MVSIITEGWSIYQSKIIFHLVNSKGTIKNLCLLSEIIKSPKSSRKIQFQVNFWKVEFNSNISNAFETLVKFTRFVPNPTGQNGCPCYEKLRVKICHQPLDYVWIILFFQLKEIKDLKLPLQGSFFLKNSSRACQPPPTRTMTVDLRIRTRRSFWESPN